MRFPSILLFLLVSASIQSQSTWTIPQVLFFGEALPSYIVGDEDPTGPIIRAAAKSDGNLQIIWCDALHGKTELLASSKIGNVFTPPINLSQSPNQESLFPDIITAPSGTTCIAWTEIDPFFESGNIYTRFIKPDGTWSVATQITDSPNTFNAFPSLAYTSQPNIFVLAYTEIMVDTNSNPSGYTIKFREINLQTSQSTPIALPEVSPIGFSFRAILVNQGTDKIHCAWYDAADEFKVYDSYIAYSSLEAGVWSETEQLSTENTISTWDDGPIKIALDYSNTLHIIWSSFSPLPSNAYIIKRIDNEPFQPPTEFYNNEVLNWAHIFGSDNTLHTAGIGNDVLKYHKFDGNTLVFKNDLSNISDGASSFPEMANISDTLHLFWVQGGKLMYSYLPLTSSSVKIEPAETNELMLSPNPCTDQLLLNLSKEDRPNKITIFDATGRLISEQNFGNSPQINVGALPPGVYALSVVIDGTQHTQTFVKH